MLSSPWYRCQQLIADSEPVQEASVRAQSKDPQGTKNHRIHFRSDGLALSTAEYARLLTRLAENDGIAADEFSRDGVVTRLEE